MIDRQKHPLEAMADELATAWAATAAVLRRHAAEGAAIAYEESARQLRARVAEYLDEALAPDLAGEESGYTGFHITRLIAEGKVPNAGSGDRPAVLRRNLPRKPGHGVVGSDRLSVLRSRDQVVRAIAEG